MSRTDAELLLQSREGDKRAFQILVQRYQQQIARTVVSMLGQIQVAEDIAQETFVRFYRSLDKFKGDSALGTYLTRIAINLSLNEIKRQKRRNLFSLQSDEGKKVLHLQDHSLSEEQLAKRDWVQQGISRLEPKFRSVLVLRMIEGYSTKETSDILSVPTGTVLSRLARAQEKLKIILTDLEK
ncbi:MAG: sigma-70 family RNA polymerase sigma factor [Bacteroidota bacterium]